MRGEQKKDESNRRVNAQKKRIFVRFSDTILDNPFYALFASVVLFLVCLVAIAILWSFMQLVENYGWINFALLIGLILLALLCLVCIAIATKKVVRRIGRSNIPRAEDSNIREDSPIARCLIYYASEDAAFAEQVYADLRSRGISCILVQSGTLGEEEKHPLIFLRGYDQMLLVLSEQSRSNIWIEQLVDTALRLEILQGRPMLFLLDVEESTGINREVWSTTRFRSHKREDFIGWEDPSLYGRGLERLITDLKGQNS